MGKARFAIGAVIGAVAGVIAGVLTAPKSGKETRADLKQKAGELKHGADEKVASVKKRGEEVAKDVKEKVEEYKERSGRAKNAAEKELKDKNK